MKNNMLALRSLLIYKTRMSLLILLILSVQQHEIESFYVLLPKVPLPMDKDTEESYDRYNVLLLLKEHN